MRYFILVLFLALFQNLAFSQFGGFNPSGSSNYLGATSLHSVFADITYNDGTITSSPSATVYFYGTVPNTQHQLLINSGGAISTQIGNAILNNGTGGLLINIPTAGLEILKNFNFNNQNGQVLTMRNAGAVSTNNFQIDALATITGFNASNNVDGYLKKDGDPNPFVFPLAQGNQYAPMSVGALGNGNVLTAAYYSSSANLAAAFEGGPFSLASVTPTSLVVSSFEYWDISTVGSPNSVLQLSFQGNYSAASITSLTIVGWNIAQSKWEVIPSNQATGLAPGNSISSSGNVNFQNYSALSIGYVPLATLTLTVNSTPTSCGNNDGTITATGSGGTPPYQYSIDGGAYQSSNIFTGITAGPHNVNLEDATGLVVSVPINVNADLCLNLISTPSGCGINSGTVTATGSGGTPPYQYSIDGGPYQTSNVFTGLAAGSHTVNMEDATGLIIMVPITVTSDFCLTINVTSTATVCGMDNGVINAIGSGGTPPYQYAIDGGTYQSSGQFSGLAAGLHNVSVEDANGLSTTVSITVAGSSNIGKISAGNDTSVAIGQPIQLNVIDLDTMGYNQFVWSPSIGLNNPDIQNPIATLISDQTYTVTATSPKGCVATAQVTIKVFSGPDIYVPNGFTPNGDGINDVFKAIPIGIQDFKYLAIFNRWGQRVFYSTNSNIGWDGTVGGKMQDAGGFVWMVEGVGFNGKIIQKKGTLVLIR